MWVKKNDDEVRQIEAEVWRAWRKRRLLYALLYGLFAAIFIGIFDFVFGGHFAQGRGITLLQGPIWVDMIKAFGFFSILTTLMFMFAKKCPFRTMFCPKCEITKSDDDDSNCPCGGKFEPFSHFKWENDEDHCVHEVNRGNA
jgi:hypothetical protein